MKQINNYIKMVSFNDYIIEKLHIDKNTKISDEQKCIDIINNYLPDVTTDKYKIIFGKYEGEIYINVKFEESQDNNDIHNWGLSLFDAIFNKDKFKELNQGSDWWCSSSKQIVLKFAYK